MRDSPCFTIFSSIALVKTPSRHKITIRRLVWRCFCRFRGTASLPIAEGSVKTWKSLYVPFGICGDIFISTLRGCARNSNFGAKELTVSREQKKLSAPSDFLGLLRMTLRNNVLIYHVITCKPDLRGECASKPPPEVVSRM